MTAYRLIEVPDSATCLEWWSSNAERFPRVAKLARAMLAAPTAALPLQRVVSALGLQVPCLRRPKRQRAGRVARRRQARFNLALLLPPDAEQAALAAPQPAAEGVAGIRAD